MEGNNQNNSQEFKREAQATVNQVKDSFKNVNVQEETNKAKNFFSGIFKAPVETISGIAHDTSNSFFKTGIILMIAWVVLSFIYQTASTVISIFSRISTSGIISAIFRFSNILGIVKSVIIPLIIVAVMSGIIYLMHSKQNKKSFLTVVNTTVASFFPLVIAKVIGMLNLISSAYKITSPIITILEIASVILLFFGVKELADEKDNNNAVKKFVIIEAIYCGVAFILGFLTLGIYII